MKLNCWEFKGCGRHPGGRHEQDLGICPSASEARLDGFHSGKNAGRVCWVVAGTMCDGTVSGTFAKKCPSCIECDFYKAVLDEEGGRFIPHKILLNILGEYNGHFPKDYSD